MVILLIKKLKMREIFKIIYMLIIVIIPYLIIIYLFPITWEKIDKLTWTTFNSDLVYQIDLFIKKIWNTKESTNDFIDWVWTNTKNKSLEQTKNINEIINQ